MSQENINEKVISNKKLGTVKWFNPKKGYGFITSDNQEIFVHQTNILSDGFRFLTDNESVEFEIVENNGKSFAKNVKKMNTN